MLDSSLVLITDLSIALYIMPVVYGLTLFFSLYITYSLYTAYKTYNRDVSIKFLSLVFLSIGIDAIYRYIALYLIITHKIEASALALVTTNSLLMVTTGLFAYYMVKHRN